MLVRREPLHPSAQQTLDDIDGQRFTALLTDQPERDLAVLERRHRARARVEDRIRGAKDTGARTLPCDTFDRNAVWLQLVLTAQDLITFTQVLTLTGELRRAEPATLRYQLLHVPARLTRTARTWTLRIQHDWPWAQALHDAFTRLRGLPQPATEPNLHPRRPLENRTDHHDHPGRRVSLPRKHACRAVDDLTHQPDARRASPTRSQALTRALVKTPRNIEVSPDNIIRTYFKPNDG